MKSMLPLALIWTLLASMVSANDLPLPDGPVVLTVSGQITHTNSDSVALFDQAMLDDLTQKATVAATPWLEGTNTFSGPMGTAILDAVGVKGQTLQVFALNDYSADVPAQDMQDHDVIFGTAMNGKRLSVRDKGPLFLIYPFDEKPELFNEIHFGRSVWQVTRIDVKD